MKWSYTRLTTFEDCRYKFLLTYIHRQPRQPLFFSGYGTYMHKILEMYLRGELSRKQLVPYYTANFRRHVTERAPNAQVFRSYFEQGLRYLMTIDFPYPDPVSTEHKVDFLIGDFRFTGIIDCVAKDNTGVVLVDHKSHPLKPYSGRIPPTKADVELSAYLRQLYLYAAAIKSQFHTYPSALVFNCFRTSSLIRVPFDEENMLNTCRWATDRICEIQQNEEWKPSPNYFRCKYLCDVHDHCEYYKML